MESLIEKVKELNMVTRHPNRDWHKMSLVLLFLAGISLLWNIYFYLSVRQSIESAETKNVLSSGVSINKESEITKTLNVYDAKRATHEALKITPAQKLEDPATS